MAVPYVKQTWTDGSGGATPLSAARLGVIEQGILDAHQMACARVFHNTTQTLTNSTTTAIAFNSERFDIDGTGGSTIHDNATNNSRLTAKVAGVYLIGCCIAYANSSAGVRQTNIRLNATTVLLSELTVPVNGDLTVVTVSGIYKLAVNDYVEVTSFQSQGSTMTLTPQANYSPEFWMSRIATG